MTSGAAAAGQLVLVATPIGNLGDLSPRAVEVLRAADVVACEDTRRTGRLLAHAGVERTPMLVVNDHTEVARTAEVVERVARGEVVAVVTDAGMPGISDPGERLVRAVLDAGLRVGAVPGPSAALTALVLSGLPAGRFCFEGFLPRSGSGRAERLAELVGERRTMVLYEAPHRLARTLRDLAAHLGGDRSVVIVRELTKLYEETWRGSLAAAAERTTTVEPRGEHTLVVAGAPAPGPATADDVDAALRRALAAGHDRKEAVRLVAVALGLPRRQVYDAALALRAAAAGGPSDPVGDQR